jgi:single-strand DNA-binding protein
MYNKVILVGRLGRDAEKRMSQAGDRIMKFSLATEEKGKNDQKFVEWHTVTLFKGSQFLEDNLRKGTTVFVEGKIRSEKYTNKAGHEVSTTVITASRVLVLSASAASWPSVSDDDITDDNIGNIGNDTLF